MLLRFLNVPVSADWLFYGSGMHRAGWGFGRCLVWGIHKLRVL